MFFHNKTTQWSIVLIYLLCFSTCSISPQRMLRENYNDDDQDDDDSLDQLVILCIDGLMGSHSTKRYLPNLHALLSKAGGTYASKVRSPFARTSDIYGWMATFNAATFEEYGCTESDDYCRELQKVGYEFPYEHDKHSKLPPSTEKYQSLLDILHAKYEYDVGVYSDCHDYHLSDVLGHNRYPSVSTQIPYDLATLVDIAMLEENLPQSDKRVLVIHTASLRKIAQSRGYGSENYKAHLLCLDAMLSKLVHKLWQWENEYSSFFLVSNHGGLGYDHSTMTLESLQVPWIGWGKHVAKRKVLFSEPLELLQFAPTVLKITLGVTDGENPIPEYWKHTYASEYFSQKMISYEHEDDGCILEDWEGPYSNTTLYRFPSIFVAGKKHENSESDRSCSIPIEGDHVSTVHSFYILVFFSFVLPVLLFTFVHHRERNGK